MLIEEGERFQDTSREELPEVPPPEEHQSPPAPLAGPRSLDQRQRLILALVGLAVGVGLAVLLAVWLQRERGD